MVKKGARKKKDVGLGKEIAVEVAGTTLRAELKNEFRRQGYARAYRDTRIISLGSIERIFDSTGTLRPSLEADIKHWRTTSERYADIIPIEKLEAYVKKQASKLYTLLQRAGRPEIIVQLFLQDQQVTDHIFEKSESPRDEPYCTREYLDAHPHLNAVAKEIFEDQWVVPPKLRRNADPKFPVDKFRFPFTEMPKPLGHGGQGQVFMVKPADEHLMLNEFELQHKGSVVAYKEVNKYGMSEDVVMSEVNTIRIRTHRHIVKLFASFSAGRENPWSETDDAECLHMLFEYTKAGNMQDWLWQESDQYSVEDRRCHIKDTIQMIVEAVTAIHEKKDGDVAFHHDLKPGNILRFEEHPGFWKICDFGMARLKNVRDGSATDKRNDNRFGTYDYQPPEYLDDKEDPWHGRPFDIWSLGCIMLELLTLWKYGRSDSGIREFYNRRGENLQVVSNKRWQEHGFQSAQDDHSFHNNYNVVLEWISHLREGSDEEEDFICILALVSEMLVDRYKRIFVWEVNIDLFELTDATQEKRKRRYREIVQPSEHPSDDASSHHNPLKRAIKRGKKWQQNVLIENKWSVSEPKPVGQLPEKVLKHTTFHSTLGACSQMAVFHRSTLFGRQDMDDRITEGFRVSNIVGLYGLPGIGKTHHAYQYVARFQHPLSAEYRRHVFWVEATTLARLKESVDQIATKVVLPVTSPEDMLPAVRHWLSSPSNGPWILVVDGLNNHTIAAYLRRLIPTDNGQILVTTKDRAIIDRMHDFRPQFRKDKNRVHVQQLPVSDLRAIFQWHSGRSLPVSPETDELLTNFSVPSLVISLARYALRITISPSRLHTVTNCGRKDGSRIHFPENMYQEVISMYHMFEPLSDSSSKLTAPIHESQPSFSPVLRLLGELSCLNKHKMDFHLIQQNYNRKDTLLEMLGMLENCSLITKGRNHETYSMPEFVQVLIHRWVFDKTGFTSLLELYRNALLMLDFQYKEETKRMMDAKKIRRSSYLSKLPLMPHFEQFLAFAREHTQLVDSIEALYLDGAERMVHSIITFAPVFVEEGRYHDAVCVLEFANTLYKGSKYRPILSRRLCEAYSKHPLANRSEDVWTKASSLLEKAIFELAQSSPKDSEEKWLCFLALSNLHSDHGKPERAIKVLRVLQAVTVRTRGFWSKEICLHRKGGQIFKPVIEKKLAVRKCIAEGRACVAGAKHPRLWQSRNKRLHTAQEAFSTARRAIDKWFPLEDRWAADLDEEITKVLCKIGNIPSIEHAITIYRKLHEKYQKEVSAPHRPWSQTRAWALKCNIVRAQIRLWSQRPASDVEETLETLRAALKFFEETHGQRDGKHDDHTRTCAYVLRDAYEALGRHDDAKNLVVVYGLAPPNYEHFADSVVEDGWLTNWPVFFKIMLFVTITSFLLFHTIKRAYSEPLHGTYSES